MSVNIDFFKFSKRTNSTKRPSTPAVTLTANLKAPCSILNPVLELATDPTEYNYCYIDKFNRYYFVGDIEFNRGLWIVPLTVDVLASYKPQIGNFNGYVLRSASMRNEFLPDAYYVPAGNLTTVINSTGGNNVNWNSGVYVVNVVSGSGNGTMSYQMTPANFSAFYSRLTASIMNLNLPDVISAIRNELVNPLQYVTSCFWFPNPFVTGDTQQSIDLGPVTINVTASKVLAPRTITYALNIPKHPQANTIGAYCNLAPYSNYSLSWGPLGSIALDPTILANSNRIVIDSIIDASTGQALISGHAVADETNKGLLFECLRGWGVPVSVNAQQGNVIGTIIDIGTTAAAMAVGDMSKAAIFAASGATVTNGVKNVLGKPSSVGSSGSLSIHNTSVRLEAGFLEHPGVDIVNNGRPLCEKRVINTLSGYMVLQSGQLDLDTTAAEREQIRLYLEGGFYYE